MWSRFVYAFLFLLCVPSHGQIRCQLVEHYNDAIVRLRTKGGNLTLTEQLATINILKEFYQMYPFRTLAINFTTPPQYKTQQDIVASLTKLEQTPFATVFDFEEAIVAETNRLYDAHANFGRASYFRLTRFYQALVIEAAYEGNNPSNPTIFAKMSSTYMMNAPSVNISVSMPNGSYFMVKEIDGQAAFNAVKQYSDSMGLCRDEATRFNLATIPTLIPPLSFSYRTLSALNAPKQANMTFMLCPVDKTNPTTCTSPYQTYVFPWIAISSICPSQGSGGSNFLPSDFPRGHKDAQSILDSYKKKDSRDTLFVSPIEKELPGFRLEPVEEEAADIFRRLEYSVEEKDQAYTYQTQPTTRVGHYITTGNVLVLKVGTFGPRSYTMFQDQIATTIHSHLSNGGTELVLDLTGNGGGYVLLFMGLLKFLFPHKSPVQEIVMDFPRNPLSDLLFSTAAEVQANGSFTPQDCDNSLFLPCAWRDAATGQTFQNISWYTDGPKNIQRGAGKMNFTKLTVFSDKVVLYQRWVSYLKQFGYENKTSGLYAPNKIYLLSAGFCGSSCSMFSSYIQQYSLGKTVVVGGIGPQARPQPMCFWSFPGGFVLSLSAVGQQAEYELFWFKRGVACQVPPNLPNGQGQRLPIPGAMPINASGQLPDPTKVNPLEYTFIQANIQMTLNLSMLSAWQTSETSMSLAVVEMAFGKQAPVTTTTVPTTTMRTTTGTMSSTTTMNTTSRNTNGSTTTASGVANANDNNKSGEKFKGPFIAMAVVSGMLFILLIVVCVMLYNRPTDQTAYQKMDGL